MRDAFALAVEAASPSNLVRRSMLLHRLTACPPEGEAVILAVGKAAAGMAKGLLTQWPLANPPRGMVLVPHGNARAIGELAVRSAGHPYADRHSLAAGAAMLDLVRGLGPKDRLLVLLSGGGSALASLPAPGVTLEEFNAVAESLMRLGASIRELNILRKNLGRVGGGKLCHAAGTRDIDLLALSDVSDDDPATIASGPFAPDGSSQADAVAVLARHAIAPAASVRRALADPANRTIRHRDPCFAGLHSEVVPVDLWIDPVAAFLAESGYAVDIPGRRLEGEARAIGIDHARTALRHAASGKRIALLSGGEATVRVRGTGYGGPSAEAALAFAGTTGGHAAIMALFADTDGIDGPTRNAGAVIVPGTLARISQCGRDVASALETSDSAALFDQTGDAFVTGPTGTNVNDFRLVLIN
ncbi:glycerate kinase type-2 family protein [Blastomonas fulva]|uniref:glycerate kinase type-2 family protein n=1 Tax=Blastomonas fulva TaxID=1550728 RepID=UPI003D2B8A3F